MGLAQESGCKGWMDKKGAKRTNWSSRWFELSRNILTYFDDNERGRGKDRKGEVNLTHVHEVRAARLVTYEDDVHVLLRTVVSTNWTHFRPPNNRKQ